MCMGPRTWTTGSTSQNEPYQLTGTLSRFHYNFEWWWMSTWLAQPLWAELWVDSAVSSTIKSRSFLYTVQIHRALFQRILQVGGGAYIKEKLYIGGCQIRRPCCFWRCGVYYGRDSIRQSFISALKVTGGVGIGLNLNVGGLPGLEDADHIGFDRIHRLTTGALKYRWCGNPQELNVKGATSFANSLS